MAIQRKGLGSLLEKGKEKLQQVFGGGDDGGGGGGFQEMSQEERNRIEEDKLRREGHAQVQGVKPTPTNFPEQLEAGLNTNVATEGSGGLINDIGQVPLSAGDSLINAIAEGKGIIPEAVEGRERIIPIKGFRIDPGAETAAAKVREVGLIGETAAARQRALQRQQLAGGVGAEALGAARTTRAQQQDLINVLGGQANLTSQTLREAVTSGRLTRQQQQTANQLLQQQAQSGGVSLQEALASGRLTRQQQQGLINQLQERTTATRPSLAQAQLKAAGERSLSQQLAAAGASRGGSASALQRTLARSQAGAGAELAQQSAQLRLQEQVAQEQQQAQARQTLAGILAQQQQAGLAQQQTALQAPQALSAALSQQRQTELEQQQAALQVPQLIAGTLAQKRQAELAQQQQALGEEKVGVQQEQAARNLEAQLIREGLAAGLTLDQARQQALQAQQTLQTQQFLEAQRITAAGEQARIQATGQLLGGVGQAGAALISDKNEKKNIKSANRDLKDFLSHLNASKFEYKEPEKALRGEGPHFSIMAQELEKSPIGQTMVEEFEGVKSVNFGKGFGAILAAQAHLNERLESLEKKRRK